MKILLILPAGDRVRVTQANPTVPRRAMLRFSVLPLTTVAALTPREHEVRIVDENVEPLDFDTGCDLVGITFMTALAPRAYEIARNSGRAEKSWSAAAITRRCAPRRRRNISTRLWPATRKAPGSKCWRTSNRGRVVQRKRARSKASSRHSGIDLPQRRTIRPALLAPIPRRELLASTARHYVTVNAVQTGRGCPPCVPLLLGDGFPRPQTPASSARQTCSRNFARSRAISFSWTTTSSPTGLCAGTVPGDGSAAQTVGQPVFH